MNLQKLSPKLKLIEPVKTYQHSAAEKFSTSKIDLEIYDSLEKCPDKSIDILLINHALYYVKDLEYVISTLLKKLSENGQMLVVLANENNSLIKLWTILFKKMGMKIPYYIAQDFRLIAANKKITCDEIKCIYSHFKFENTPDNRFLMAQFLLGEHSKKMTDNTIQKYLAGYKNGNIIELPLEDSLFILKNK